MYKNNVIISIVTYNSKNVFKLLKKLKNEIGFDKKYLVIVFDNNSDNDFIKKLNFFVPWIILYKSKKNLGFGYGHNFILKKNKNSKYAFIINPDVLINKRCFEELLKKILINKRIGIVCPKILNFDGTIQYIIRKKITLFGLILRFLYKKKIYIFKKYLYKYECRNILEKNKNIYIKICSGCFMLIDLKKFKNVNGFDEKFFLYFEDSDLCLKFLKFNYYILYIPYENIIHLYERGEYKNFKLFKQFIKSMIIFFNKWGWKIF